MSAPINDGGPAFPCESYGHRNGKETTVPAQGMTLRDYLAGQALAGIVPQIEAKINELSYKDENFESEIKVFFQVSAYRAYTYADAMIAVREVKK
jgi:hypothetical protein